MHKPNLTDHQLEELVRKRAYAQNCELDVRRDESGAWVASTRLYVDPIAPRGTALKTARAGDRRTALVSLLAELTDQR